MTYASAPDARGDHGGADLLLRHDELRQVDARAADPSQRRARRQACGAAHQARPRRLDDLLTHRSRAACHHRPRRPRPACLRVGGDEQRDRGGCADL